MKPWLTYTLAGVLGYLVFLLATFPAAHAYRWSGAQSAGLGLHSIAGTVWSGTAGGAVIDKFELPPITWRWRLTGMFRGRLEYRLQVVAQQSEGHGILGLGWDGGWQARDVALPARLLQPYLGALVPPLGGRLTLNVEGDRIATQSLPAVQGDLVWRGAAVRMGEMVSLGDVRMDIETTEQGIRGVLSNDAGPLRLEGTLLLRSGGAYEFSGGLSKNGPLSAGLEKLVDTLGKPDARGLIPLRFTGTI